MFLWGWATSYVFYLDARYYTGALLATNGAGTVIIQEWLYNELPKMEGPYPAPALRVGAWSHLPHTVGKADVCCFITGQALAAMCISIIIAALFQIFVFRSPARHQLRLQIARVTYGLMSLNTLFQSNVSPPPPPPPPPPPSPARDPALGYLC